jgi:5'-nucleotidase
VPAGFTYTFDMSRPPTDRVVPGSVKVNGVAVDPLAGYRVAMNDFLASGGDGFSVFNEGTDQVGGEIDIDALVAYFQAHSPISPGPQDRVTRIG